MRISIVGGSGFIGGATAKILRERGCDVYLPDRHELAQGPPKGGWGVLIWAAGLTANFRQHPFDTVRAHVSDLATLLAGRMLDGLIYLSSTRVYMGAESTNEDALVPSSAQDPSYLYNISKLMGESLCLNTGLDNVKIARLSNVVGPGEVRRSTFVGALCREAKQGHISLQTDADSQKDYLWIDDAANYLARMTIAEGGGIFNVASGIQTPHHKWVDALAQVSGATIDQKPYAPDGSFPKIDIARLEKQYGKPGTDPLDRIDEILHSDSQFMRQ